MRRHLILALVGLGLTVLAGGVVYAKDSPKPDEASGKFGTRVEFVATPKEAADLARKGEKLVFVLHVSGDFETPECT